MIYFKFKDQKKNIEVKRNTFYDLIGKFLKLIIPSSNPDYDDDLFDKVKIWFIEYDEINDYVNREIGLDKNNEVIIKNPYKESLGLWTDEDLSLDEYKKFNIEYIQKNDFHALWELL